MDWRAILRSLFQTAQGVNTLMSGAFGLGLTFFFAYQAARGVTIAAGSVWSALLYLSLAAFFLSGGRVIFAAQSRILELEGERTAYANIPDTRIRLIQDARKIAKQIRLLLERAHTEVVDNREQHLGSPAIPEALRATLPESIANAKNRQRIRQIEDALRDFIPFRASAITTRDAILLALRIPPVGRSVYTDASYENSNHPHSLETIAGDLEVLAQKLEDEVNAELPLLRGGHSLV